MADTELKACRVCGQRLPLPDFEKDNRRADGTSNRCKPCVRARSRELYATSAGARIRAEAKRYYEANRAAMRERQHEYYLANKHVHKAKARRWREANPERYKFNCKANIHRRRAKMKGGVSGAELREWVNAAKKVCYWCGKRCPKRFDMDHYLPLCLGGKHELSNLVIACQSCNRRKQGRHPTDFAKQVGRLL